MVTDDDRLFGRRGIIGGNDWPSDDARCGRREATSPARATTEHTPSGGVIRRLMIPIETLIAGDNLVCWEEFLNFFYEIEIN